MNQGLTIVIPVLNEEEILVANTQELLRYLVGLGHPYEIILVSNGSSDQTNHLGHILSEDIPEVRFFELAEKGVGRAFVLAVRQARFDRIVSVDMDLSIDLSLIPRAFGLLDEFDIVVGSKKMGSQKRTLWRKAGSTVYILAARLMLGLSFEDYSIAAKAYQRAVIMKYLNRIDHGTSYVIDVIFHTLKDGGKAVEIPVHCEDFRPSKFNLVREALYRFRNLFRLWWNYRVYEGPRDNEP